MAAIIKDSEITPQVLYKFVGKETFKLPCAETGTIIRLVRQSIAKNNTFDYAELFPYHKVLDINMRDYERWTPLMHAIVTVTPAKLAVLLDAGADVNAYADLHLRCDGFSVLINAAANPNPKVLPMLIEAGVDVNKRTKAGNPLNFYAMKQGNPEMVSLLIKAGADVMESAMNGTVLHHSNLHPESFAMIIEAGADVNAKNKDGWSPLMFAAEYSNPKVCAALIKAGADVNAKNKDGWSPLMKAAIRNSQEVCELLIKAGADIYESILHLTASCGNSKVCSVLINAGADINARAKKDSTPLSKFLSAKVKEDFTPLMVAALRNPEVFATLIEAGADTTLKDVYEKNALDYAKTNDALKDTDAYWKLHDASFE